MRTLSSINIVLAVICFLIGVADSQKPTETSVTDAKATPKTVISTYKTLEMAVDFPDDKVVAASRRNAR